MNPQDYLNFKKNGKVVSIVNVSPDNYLINITTYDAFGNSSITAIPVILSNAQDLANAYATLVADLLAVPLPVNTPTN